MNRNKILTFMFSIIVIFSGALSCQVKKSSFHRNDNDFSTYNDKNNCEEILLSKVAYMKIAKSIDKIKKSISPIKIDDYYLHTIHVNDTVDIIVLSIKSFVLSEHHFFVFNTKTNKVEKSNFSINGKWSNNNEDGFDIKLMELPNIKIENQENGVFISIKERVHNGNSYNALMQKFYKIDIEKLALDLMYCLEIKAIGYNNVVIERILDGNIVKVYTRDKNMIKEIGNFTLSKDFKIIESKNCLDDFYCNQLVTCSGKDDQIILNEGYSFRY